MASASNRMGPSKKLHTSSTIEWSLSHFQVLTPMQLAVARSLTWRIFPKPSNAKDPQGSRAAAPTSLPAFATKKHARFWNTHGQKSNSCLQAPSAAIMLPPNAGIQQAKRWDLLSPITGRSFLENLRAFECKTWLLIIEIISVKKSRLDNRRPTHSAFNGSRTGSFTIPVQ